MRKELRVRGYVCTAREVMNRSEILVVYARGMSANAQHSEKYSMQ